MVFVTIFRDQNFKQIVSCYKVVWEKWEGGNGVLVWISEKRLKEWFLFL